MALIRGIKKTLGLGGSSEKMPQGPDLSPLINARTQAQERSSQFRANQSGMQEDADRASRMQARSELSRQMQNIGSNFNQRGLLYSGLKGASEMGANAQTASALSNQSMADRDRLEGTARDFENQAIQSGLDYQGAQQSASDMAFQNALAQRQARNGVLGSLFGAVGQVGGSLLGKKS